MLIAAALIGALTAYYFGIRPGVITAGTCLVLFLVAMVMPSTRLYIYAAVGIGVVGVCLLGPRMGKTTEARTAVSWARKGAVRVWRTVDKLRDKLSS